MDKTTMIEMVSLYERTDIIMSANMNGVTSMSIYVSVVAAYLVAAFVAGHRLSRPQLLITSTLFVVFALILIMQTFTFFSVAIIFVAPEHETTPSIMAATVGIVQLVGIIAALSFMRYSRQQTERETD